MLLTLIGLLLIAVSTVVGVALLVEPPDQDWVWRRHGPPMAGAWGGLLVAFAGLVKLGWRGQTMRRSSDSPFERIASWSPWMRISATGQCCPWTGIPGVIRIKAVPTSTEMIESVLFPFLERAADREFSDRLVIVRSSGVRWIRTGRGGSPG